MVCADAVLWCRVDAVEVAAYAARVTVRDWSGLLGCGALPLVVGGGMPPARRVRFAGGSQGDGRGVPVRAEATRRRSVAEDARWRAAHGRVE